MNTAALPHFKQLFDSLVHYAHGKGVPFEDAEDLVASAIESAVKKFDPERGKFQALCTTAVSNLIKNFWRNRKPGDNGIDPDTLEDSQWAKLFFEDEETKVMKRRIAQIMTKLDGNERAFLEQLQLVIEEMGDPAVSEAARRLDLPAAKGWDLLRKIRRKVQRQYPPLLREAAASPSRTAPKTEIVAEFALRYPVPGSAYERLLRRLQSDRLMEIELALAEQ
ncbi:MAG: sigma factor [Bacteroidota bacterium]